MLEIFDLQGKSLCLVRIRRNTDQKTPSTDKLYTVLSRNLTALKSEGFWIIKLDILRLKSFHLSLDECMSSLGDLLPPNANKEVVKLLHNQRSNGYVESKVHS